MNDNYDNYDDFEDLPEDTKNSILEINSEITACSQCQPYDNEDKDIVWVWGDRYEISDILFDNDIPEEQWDSIIPYLECPQCGRAFEHYSDEVGIISEYEFEYRRKYDAIVEKTKDKIQSFYDFLSKYPYLGLDHEVGQEIYKEIKEMSLMAISDKYYFRARKPDNGKIFGHEEMLNPPQEAKIPEGRFNHYGQSHLYLGDSEELCAKEIANEEKELLWIQKYRIKQLTNVLDISEIIDEDNIDKIPLFFSGLFISGQIDVQRSKDISWTPEYFIPRFIADIAKSNGINGILYNSTKAPGRNLVIFDLNNCEYEFCGEPYTLIFDKKSYRELF